MESETGEDRSVEVYGCTPSQGMTANDMNSNDMTSNDMTSEDTTDDETVAGEARRRRRIDPTAPIVRRQRAPMPELPNLPVPTGKVESAYVDFLPPAQRIVETPPSFVRRALAYVLCGIVVAALVTSLFYSLRLFAIAPGEFQPRGGSQIVQPKLAGQVKSISATNGAHVEKGDILVVLDPTSALAAQTIAQSRLIESRAEVLRRRAAIAGGRLETLDKAAIDKAASIDWPKDIPAEARARQDTVLRADLAQLGAQLADLKAKLTAKEAARDKYTANIAAQKTLIASRTERTGMHEKLAAEGYDSRARVLQALEPLRQEQVTLATLEGALDVANAGTLVLKNEIAAAHATFMSSNTDALATAERQIADLEQQLAKASWTLANMTVRAPVSGTIQALAVVSVGQAVKPGEILMQVAPEGTPLEVQAYVSNSDVGFVRVGQPATIKVDSFPFTRYGTIAGRVTHVGADAITGSFALAQQKNDAVAPTKGKLSVTTAAQQTSDLVFPVTVVPERTTVSVAGKDVPVSAGMSVVAEIETDRQKVINYILYPLTRVFQR